MQKTDENGSLVQTKHERLDGLGAHIHFPNNHIWLKQPIKYYDKINHTLDFRSIWVD